MTIFFLGAIKQRTWAGGCVHLGAWRVSSNWELSTGSPWNLLGVSDPSQGPRRGHHVDFKSLCVRTNGELIKQNGPDVALHTQQERKCVGYCDGRYSLSPCPLPAIGGPLGRPQE